MKRLIIIYLTLFSNAYATKSSTDKHQHKLTQAIHVQADQMSYDGQKHCGQYQGNVRVIQGDLHLYADSAITKLSANNKLTYARAYSTQTTPTHFWTKLKPTDPWFHAYAKIIEYKPSSHQLILRGDAHINQGKNHLYASTIYYDLKNQHLTTNYTNQTPTIIQLYPESNHE